MSIASRITEIEQHLIDDYSVLTLAGADLTNVDKNIVNLKPTWKERLLYFINNGTDVVWNNWTKVQGTGTILTLNNTLQAPMKVDLKGNTYQNGEPTPSTPIDIQVVSGDNTIEICGKNLYKPFNFTKTNNQVTYTYNENGSININGTASSNSYSMGTSECEPYLFTLNSGTYILSGTISNVRLQLVDKDGNITAETSGGVTQITFTTTEKRILFLRLRVASGQQVNNQTIYPMLEVGSTATTYQPYVSQTYPINLGNIELCKIGDYQDYIYKDNGKWYLHKEIGKVVLNGSEEGWNETSGNAYITINGANRINALSNNFIYSSTKINYGYIKWSPSQPWLVFFETITTQGSLDNFKTWLSTHNTTVYYILATPTNTPLEDLIGE